MKNLMTLFFYCSMLLAPSFAWSNGITQQKNMDEFITMTKAIKCPAKGARMMQQMCFVTRNSILASVQAYCSETDCQLAKTEDYLTWLEGRFPDNHYEDDGFTKKRNEHNYVEVLTTQFEFHCSWYAAHRLMTKDSIGGDSATIHHMDALKSIQKLLTDAAPDDVGGIIAQVCPNFYTYD